MTGFDERAKLGHRCRLRFRRVRKWRRRIVVERENFATQNFQPAWTQQRTRAVTTIDRHYQPAFSNRLDCKRALQCFDMLANRVSVNDRLLDCFPVGFQKLALVKNVEQFLRLLRIEVKTVAANKLQCVPTPGIVTGSDRDAAVSLQPFHCQLHTRRRTNAEIYDFAPRCQQTRQNGRTDHRTRRTGVAADEDSSAVEIGAESLGKLDRKFGRDGLAYNTADTGDADF